ncbi:MAG: hypothetical protein AB1391_00110 [Candidatus Micrarchaeota archaeon]
MKPSEYINKIYLTFKKRDAKKLRLLGDVLLCDASLESSKAPYYSAVISYVLSKILSKPRFLRPVHSEQLKSIEMILREFSTIDKTKCLDEKFLECFEKIEFAIKKLEADDPRFVVDLISKGKLKAAAILYAQGLSLGTAADITGVQKQEILSYAGHTMMFDRLKEEKKTIDRLKLLIDITKE